MSAYGRCSTHGNTKPRFLVSKRAQFIPMEGRWCKWYESEWECDNDKTVCDDDDITGSNGEISNADDDGACNVPYFFLFE